MTVLNLCAPSFDPYDSYGRIACELASGLQKLGVHVNPLGLDGTRFDDKPIQPVLGGLMLAYPTNFRKFGAMANAGPRIALTMFESSILPDGWVNELNKCAAVIVPSTWCRRIFVENGVKAPIYVVPLGISETFKQDKVRSMTEPFTFIACADRGSRKGWQQAALAFHRAFGDDMRFRLILKARKLPLQITNPNIELITEDYTDEQLVELYHRCHIFLAPATGEGFGFLPREFAATGGLALVTSYSGLADDLRYWGVPIPYHTTPAWKEVPEWYGKLGVWAQPDTDALVSQMKWFAAQYENYQPNMRRAAQFVAEQYRWDAFAKRVYGIWQSVMEDRYARNAG